MLTGGKGGEPHRRTERGSVALAMIVLMLITILGVAVISRSQVHLETAARGSDAAAAEAGADQGVAEALALIDGGQRVDFSGGADLPGGSYRYEAVAISAESYEIYAEAEVDGVTRAVEVLVGGRALSPYTLFVDTGADFEGNASRIGGRVGTNGPFRVRAAAPRGTVDLFGPAATCDRCRTIAIFDEPRDIASPEPPVGGVQDCPADGLFSGPVSGRGGIPFLCDPATIAVAEVMFTGTLVVVDGPLVIHVLEGLDVEMSDATINADGLGTDFELFLSGTGNQDVVVISDTRIDGVVYAPGRRAEADAAEIVGSLTVGELTVARGRSLSIEASGDLNGQVSGWELSSWEQVPAR